MTRKPPVFGEKGKTDVKFTGILPFEHRGVCTSTLYVWNERHHDRWVDKRDLPHLVKMAGRENLQGNDMPVEISEATPSQELDLSPKSKDTTSTGNIKPKRAKAKLPEHKQEVTND